MDRLRVKFSDVAETLRSEIRSALYSMHPPRGIVADYTLLVHYGAGKYSVGYIAHGNRDGVSRDETFLPSAIEETEPEGIARGLKALIEVW